MLFAAVSARSGGASAEGPRSGEAGAQGPPPNANLLASESQTIKSEALKRAYAYLFQKEFWRSVANCMISKQIPMLCPQWIVHWSFIIFFIKELLL